MCHTFKQLFMRSTTRECFGTEDIVCSLNESIFEQMKCHLNQTFDRYSKMSKQELDLHLYSLSDRKQLEHN